MVIRWGELLNCMLLAKEKYVIWKPFRSDSKFPYFDDGTALVCESQYVEGNVSDLSKKIINSNISLKVGNHIYFKVFIALKWKHFPLGKIVIIQEVFLQDSCYMVRLYGP